MKRRREWRLQGYKKREKEDKLRRGKKKKKRNKLMDKIGEVA